MDLIFWLLIISLSLIMKCETSNALQWNLDLQNNLYWAIGCDFHENNLKNEKMVGEKCGKACAQTPGCTHFSWTNLEGGTCWMKTNAISKESALKANEGFVCGLIKQKSNSIDWNNDSNQVVWAHACDWKENDLSNSQAAGKLCGAQCLQTPECTHFTWTTYNGGTCWMKKGSVSKSNAFSTGDMTMVCGVLDENLNVSSGIDSLKGQLLWSDEFDSLSSFMSNWNQETGGHGWGNNELQYYTNNNENTEISNGMLTIHTRKEWKNNMKFTSARLMSTKKFRYGVYEMKAQLPYGRGTWPAFWLLSAGRPLNWPNDGEIDIMEHVGYEQNIVHATIHCKDFNHIIGTQIGKSTKVNDVSNQFHLYQLYWSETSIRGYVDGQIYFRYDRPANSNYNNWPFDNEFNIILNTAVGGFWGGALGIDENIFPQKYVIDYVRHYAHK